MAMANVNNTYSLRQLFNGRLFRVPDFQRGYSWEESNIRDFLDDLKYLSGDRVHYTGTVVIHSQGQAGDVIDEDGEPLKRTDIVDGQQRLTTAVILLDCIRRALTGLGDSALADGIMKRFIRTLDEVGQPQDRLKLNAGTNAFFQRNVLAEMPGRDETSISSETRLMTARQSLEKYVCDEVSKRDRDLAGKWLRGLHQKITNRLRFSLYEVDSEAEVGIIFEVMNDRGKPLSQLEMVKNYLLYAGASLGVTDRVTAQVNHAWSKILSRLMAADVESSQDEDRLLRTHWVTRYDPSSRNRVNIHSVKARFNVRSGDRASEQLIGRLTDYITDLEQSSVPFCQAYKPSLTGAFAPFEASPRIRDEVVLWSSNLVRLGMPVSFLPLLMAVRMTHPHDAAKYLETLKLCEAYAFRIWTLKKSRSNAGRSTLFRAAHELRTGKSGFKDAIDAVKAELAWRCGDSEYTAQFEKLIKDAQWYRWRGLRYMLYEYEIHLSIERKADPMGTLKNLIGGESVPTIEHILPQSIENMPAWKAKFSDEEHRRCLNDIGNLTLSRFNESLSNRPFDEKKGTAWQPERYISSPFFQEGDLVHYPEWTPETIVERRERIINWAKQRWSIDLSDASDDRDEVDEDDIDDLSEE